jgi:hypothetical protein
MFENRVLRRIFGCKKDEATREWRRLHNKELNDLYSSPNVIRVIKSRRMRWAGHVARMEEKRGPYRILVGRPEGRRPLGTPRCRWEDNIFCFSGEGPRNRRYGRTAALRLLVQPCDQYDNYFLSLS